MHTVKVSDMGSRASSPQSCSSPPRYGTSPDFSCRFRRSCGARWRGYKARAVLAATAYYTICPGGKTRATCKNELTNTHSVREALINCLRGMKRKAHGAQEPRHIWKYVEVTSTAQRGDSPAQAINQRFLRNVNLGRQTCPLAPPPFNWYEISG